MNTEKKRRAKSPAQGQVGEADQAEKPQLSKKQLVNMVIQLGFIALAFVAIFGFVRAARNDQLRSLCSATCSFGPSYAGRNLKAPDFTLPDLDGKQVSLSEFKGRTVILNFWASWCEPCREEMPALARLGLMLKDRKDVVLLTITTDEDLSAAKDTLATLFAADEELKEKVPKGTFPFVVLLDPELKVVTEKFGTTKYPETWVIDDEGFIRARFDGARDWGGARALSVFKAMERGPGCLVDFNEGKAVGRYAELCAPE